MPRRGLPLRLSRGHPQKPERGPRTLDALGVTLPVRRLSFRAVLSVLASSEKAIAAGDLPTRAVRVCGLKGLTEGA
jgi:hypothetical protein